MSDPKSDSEYEKLYYVLIEELDLSNSTINILKRQGITTLGDCIDFYSVSRSGTVQVKYEFAEVMFNEVLDQLKRAGYMPSE